MPTRTTTFATNDVLTANDLNALAGAWNSYTPTLAQDTSTNIAKTVTYAKYLQFGKLVIVQFHLVASAAGTGGSAVTVSLPVTAAYAAGAVGSGIYVDSGTAIYSGVANLSTTTKMQLYYAGGIVGSNPSLAVASGDVFHGFAMYEAA